MMSSYRRLDRLSWVFGVPGSIVQVIGLWIRNSNASVAYPLIILGAAFVALGLSLILRARGLNPVWSLVAVVPVVGWLVWEFWLLGRLDPHDDAAA